MPVFAIGLLRRSSQRTIAATTEVTEAVEKIALETPGIAHTVAVPGQSFVLNAVSSNYGAMFVILKPFHERRESALTGEAIAARLRATLRGRRSPLASRAGEGPAIVSGTDGVPSPLHRA